MTSGLHAEEKLPISETLSDRTKEFLSDPSRTGSLVGSILAGAAVANPLAPLLGSMAGFMIGKSSAFTQKDDNNARRQAYLNRSLMPEDGSEITGLAGLTGNPSAQEPDHAVITGMFGEEAVANSLPQIAPLNVVTLPGETGEATGTSIQTLRTRQIVIVDPSVEPGMANPSKRAEPLVTVKLPNEPTMGAAMGAAMGAPVGPAMGSAAVVDMGSETVRGVETQNWPEQTERPAALELARDIEARINLQKQLAYACSNMEATQPLSTNCYYYSQ